MPPTSVGGVVTNIIHYMQKITYIIGILVLLISTGIAIEDPLPSDAYVDPLPSDTQIVDTTTPVTLYPGDFILDGNTYVTILNLDGEIYLLKLVDF